jgi:hypothetical protein
LCGSRFYYTIIYIFDLRKLMLFIIADLFKITIENIKAGEVSSCLLLVYINYN